MTLNVDGIWEYAFKRHMVYLRRQEGLPRDQWTADPIIATYKFCNNYRELDRTTVWFKDNIREPLRAKPEVLLATVLFRWFNRITTGEALWKQTIIDMVTGNKQFTGWDIFNETHEIKWLKGAIQTYCGNGPYVTGAFIIKTPDGMTKLNGVLWAVDQFVKQKHYYFEKWFEHEHMQVEVAHFLLEHRDEISCQHVYTWLREYPYMGGFMAAQVIADLKYTDLLNKAPDFHTFAASGPGSRKGLNLVYGRDPGKSWNERDWHAHLIRLQNEISPRFEELGWEVPHAQDLQNICCEFSKYSRGYSRNRYRG